MPEFVGNMGEPLDFDEDAGHEELADDTNLPGDDSPTDDERSSSERCVKSCADGERSLVRGSSRVFAFTE